jgi:hypothetical protein
LLLNNIHIKIHTSIILPVVLYGCKTLSPILREEHRLRALRRIFGPKRKKIKGEWGKIYNEELNPYPTNMENMVSF